MSTIKIKLTIFLIFSFTVMLSGCSSFDENKLNEKSSLQNSLNISNSASSSNNDFIEVGIVGDDKTINRALVSKMLALLNSSKAEIISQESEISFRDVQANEWYYKYVNSVFINGDMSGVSEEEFKPLESLTIMQTQYLINKYDDTKKIHIDNENQDKAVSYALWCEIYKQISEDREVIEETIIILGTSDTINSLSDGYAVTDKGLMSFEGLDVEDYINKQIKVLRKDKEVIAITEVISNTPTLSRVMIINNGTNYVDIYVGGVTKRLYFQNLILNENSKIADIKINGNVVEAIEYYHDTLNGIVTKIRDDVINIDNIDYVLDDEFRVYSNIGGNFATKDRNDIIIGQSTTTFYKKGNENKLYGAVIDSDLKLDTVRVLINDDSFENVYFEDIQLYSDDGIKIIVRGVQDISNNITIKNGNDFDILENEVILLENIDKSRPIIFSNLKRGYENVEFYGNLEISKVNDKYVVVNILDIEEYISSVMSSDDRNYREDEILKTMSVIYRTNLLNSIIENNLAYMGANVDDSSKYQLFNNLEITEINRRVAEETRGEVILNNGELIIPMYFDYSGGTSGNSGEVWAYNDYYGYTDIYEYPTNSENYLLYKSFFSDTIYYDFYEEVNANIFFKSKDVDFIENESDWFRWCSVLEIEKIEEILNNLQSIYNELENPKNYIYMVNGEEFNINIGNIKDINIIERGEGGNVMKIELMGANSSIIIETSELISQIFSPSKTINNKGNAIELEFIPSSYFVFDKVFDNGGNLNSLTFYGGGYGHGVGMSLYGAIKMSLSGYSYKEILNTYYSNISIEVY